MKTLGKVTKTARGFPMVEFKDFYGHPCSVQMSSIWLEENKPGNSALWIGVYDAKPMVLHKYARAVGVESNATCGWVPYPIPEEVSLTTRMHLNREQVKALIGHLQRWLDKGKL